MSFTRQQDPDGSKHRRAAYARHASMSARRRRDVSIKMNSVRRDRGRRAGK